jgi:gluconolactonase
MNAQPIVAARTRTFTEGPAFDYSGNLFFTHNEGIDVLYKDGRQATWIADTAPGYNGHKILPNGTHLVCASKAHQVQLRDPQGQFLRPYSEESEGRPLRAPNDITLSPEGGIYFSDPGGSRQAPIGTVHYVNPQGVTTTIAGGLRVPNGLVIDHRRRLLYLSETVPNRIIALPVLAPGKLGPMRIFAELPARAGHQAEPDGLALDATGNLYVAHLNTGNVEVLSPQGKILRSLSTGLYDVSNLAFRGSQLFVTGSIGHRSNTEGRLIRLDLAGVRGIPALLPQKRI